MRKKMLALALLGLVMVGGCAIIPGGKYNASQRWNQFTQDCAKIWNVVDIYFFNYDITDPYVGAPFFGDPH
jgi:hypothetical protein